MSQPTLVAPPDAHRFDEERLFAHLEAALEDFVRPASVRMFQGGQSNPTFLIETAVGRFVVRKKPPGTLLPSAHQVEREYRVIRALEGTPVPVPRARLLCEDTGILGTAFYVMDYIDGRVFAESRMKDASPEERRGAYLSMAETLGKLHAVDWREVGLSDFGKPEGYVARQVGRWSKQFEASKTGKLPEMEKLAAFLAANVPTRERTTIAHGDFRLGNMIYGKAGTDVLAVLDWELATLGHPISDLAYMCMNHHVPPHGNPHGLLAEDLGALGIPSEAEVVAAYGRIAGEAGLEDFPYFRAFSFFRMASIIQGVYARSLQGNAADPWAAQAGAFAVVLAKTGWQLAREAGA